VCTQAFYTEPDDQSAWWYHRFLIHWAGESLSDDTDTEHYTQLLRDEVLASVINGTASTAAANT
jgi:hypothetical protein